MKKRLSLVIVLAIVLAIAIPVLACCRDTVTVTAIEFVNPTRQYTVGATIDYDNLQVKVTYSNNTTATKTVKQLRDDGATLATADLSKAGNTSYSLTYKGQVDTVQLTVVSEGTTTETRPLTALRAPQGYADYLVKSADRQEGDEETRAEFRKTGETYEIGNVNKFIFRVGATVRDQQAEGGRVNINEIQTVAKVYIKDNEEGDYEELTGDDVADYVAIENSTYKFTEAAGGKYVKLEISPAEQYNVAALSESQRTITVEAVIVDGGYNVYDQLGLSVMADLQKRFWSEIWKSEYSYDMEKRETYATATADSVKLEADDKPLCEYVGNIKWVILHNSIVLDPDQMPSLYFWTDQAGAENNVGFTEAKTSIEGFSKSQDTLVGTLRSGDNGGQGTNENYARVMDAMSEHVNEQDQHVDWYEPDHNGVKINGNIGITTGFGLNMAKGLFCTSTTSVSGNYQSVTYTERSQRSAHGRILLEYVDWDASTDAHDPVSNWSVFLFYQSMLDGADLGEYTLKNIAMKGNNPNESNPENDEDSVLPAGIMMSTVFAWKMHYDNVNADQLFSNFIHDNYATSGFWVNADKKIVTGDDHTDCTVERTDIYIENTKAYNSYSNMSYAWRGHVNVINSELIGSGGPLFILTDDDHSDTVGNAWAGAFTGANTSDDGGPSINIDSKSVLQAFATGDENWYQIYKAQTAFQTIKGTLNEELVQKYLGKTLTFGNPDNPLGGDSYVNVVAIMIPKPSYIFNGTTFDDSKQKLDVRGVFTQTDDKGNEENVFAMHNNVINTARRFASGNSSLYPIVLQSGKSTVLYNGEGLYNTSTVDINGIVMIPNQTIPAFYAAQLAQNAQAKPLFTASGMDPDAKAQEYLAQAQLNQNDILAWRTETSKYACLYISAGAIPGSNTVNAPYFGVVMQIGNYTPTAA